MIFKLSEIYIGKPLETLALKFYCHRRITVYNYSDYTRKGQ